ncbi:RNA methyltransferase [Paenibacillus sp. alder61]|uniref:RNA methyltransferase n=1 Tax=Paenibacillus faecis TaxID=862114 RepID=A0A5D0D0C7_9BACL|nr:MULTISPECIES: RNA methyltransferase [Paenibacillus]MCA1296418.1 RNA methyltransferase [Paenibacillus sp. alder61]TYA15490.1 RNA methyltransferase [Paenibacillus faecis]
MQILSPQNGRVKEWAGLLEKKHRDKQGKFLIEGIHLVQEALEARADIECVCYDAEGGIPAELAQAASAGLDVEWIAVSAAVIAKCSDTKTPQPVFAVVRKADGGAEPLLGQAGGLVVVLDGVQDPGNVGTIIRTADAVGADGVIVGAGCADIYGPKVLRATMGSIFHLPVVHGKLAELLPQAKRRGIRLAGTSLQGAVNCFAYDFTGPVWLLFGSEGSGLSPEVRELMDDGLIIPMRGRAESLNVAMAASVLLYEALRQRHFSNNNNSRPMSN